MITVTEKAANRVADLLVQNPESNGLRIFIKGGGCGGYQYGFAFESEAEQDDQVTTVNGVLFYFDVQSAELMGESVVDYVDSIEGSSFQIKNPQAKSTCGCGQSFSCGT